MTKSISPLSERQAKALSLFLGDLSLQSRSTVGSTSLSTRIPAPPTSVTPTVVPAASAPPPAAVPDVVCRTAVEDVKLPEPKSSPRHEVDLDPAADDSGSENDGVKRWLISEPRKPRKITERKREDAAAFDVWLERNQKELSVDGRPIQDEERTLAWLVKDDGCYNIIDSPYDYQIELFERAKQQNTIAVLDTGMYRQPRLPHDTNPSDQVLERRLSLPS